MPIPSTCLYFRRFVLSTQLLKERTNRLNPPMKIWNMKLLIGRMQIVVGQSETHHHRWNLEHILKIGHDRNRSTRTDEHGFFLERIAQSFCSSLDETIVGSN